MALPYAKTLILLTNTGASNVDSITYPLIPSHRVFQKAGTFWTSKKIKEM